MNNKELYSRLQSVYNQLVEIQEQMQDHISDHPFSVVDIELALDSLGRISTRMNLEVK